MFDERVRSTYGSAADVHPEMMNDSMAEVWSLNQF
jgi:hypothetical protein